jgi:hypothetical protein
MIFIGVDPGLSGAFACIWDVGDAGLKVTVHDIPVIKVGKRHEYSVPEIIKFFENRKPCFVALEALHAMPRTMCSVMGNFSLGRSSGLFEGIIAALKIPFDKVPPQRWKKIMLDGMPAGKNASIVVARRLFPDVDLPRKKDHGKADALLMAEFVRRKYKEVPIDLLVSDPKILD